MLVSNFPRVTFVSESGAETDLDLAGEGAAIAALALEIGRKFPDAKRIGLVFRSTPELVIAWLAVLAAAREPLILQYPTKKQTWLDWSRSIANTIGVAEIEALLVGEALPADTFGLPSLAVTKELISPAFAAGVAPIERIDAGSILQLSSGTTGHRKPIRFTLDQVKRHVGSYSRVLLSGTEDDCIVSWLPLYHDMGFVACFLLPLLTGTRLVMMDPMDWLGRPTLLYDAIERHRGTICYLPNFAFEVMARHRGHGPFPTMRRWISCSEPVYEATMRRFMQATNAPAATMQACYAMAENVFAVTQSEGLVVVDVNGERRVSCGFPIPDCDVKLIDGQIFVRSNASINGYVGGEPIVDAEGYYPTGDLGTMTDTGLVVSGRVHDLINVAGRKYFLNDLDRALNQAVPEARGRAVTCVHRVSEMGTEQPVFFAEDAAFYDRQSEEPSLRARIAELAGIETVAFHFVPPNFITKTSSGKANRKATMKNWLDAFEWRRSAAEGSGKGDLQSEIRQYFGELPLDQPIREVVDSLGFASLQLLAEAHSVSLDPDETLGSLLDRARGSAVAKAPAEAKGEHISIVALADSRVLSAITDDVMRACAERVGCPVKLEHLCLPPTPVLLQDLIFHDYFLVRGRNDDFHAVETTLRKLKEASLIVIDDTAELGFPLEQVYPQLDSQFRRDTDASLLAFRWQQYVRHHHRLPLTTVHGAGLPNDHNPSIDALSRYVGAPIFRIATLTTFQDVTKEWDFVKRGDKLRQRVITSPPGLPAALIAFVASHANELRRLPGTVESKAQMIDLSHFCSWFIDRDKLVSVLDKHQKFCVLGAPSSVSFIADYLTERQKPFFYSNTLNLKHLDPKSFDCVLMTGAWGKPDTKKPVYQIFFAGFANDHDGLGGEHFAHARLVEARRRVEAVFMEI